MLIRIIFPQTHLELYVAHCRQIEFDRRHVIHTERKDRMFFPYRYDTPFTKDCIIEMKERNNHSIAKLFSSILAGWIAHTVTLIRQKDPHATYILVPVPQHISKTREKGFCHTITLAQQVCTRVNKICGVDTITLQQCVKKTHRTKRLHDLKNKRGRFSTISHTMNCWMSRADAMQCYFFVLDDVYTTGATFKEMRRSLLDCGAFQERIFFVSIAH